jgi:hypothetical protein
MGDEALQKYLGLLMLRYGQKELIGSESRNVTL